MKEEDENDNLKIFRMSSFQRTVRMIEINIFSFFYTLLEDKEEYYNFNILAITINFIQAIGFAFRDDVNPEFS